jgi:predicted Rossmann fold nucleotide-binding protein DprA/Smf involved in DNA uptake
VTGETLTDDAQAILLLCSTLALPRSPGALKPLSRAEWNLVARAISTSRIARPAGLLGSSADDIRRELRVDSSLADRITALLERGGQLAIERSRLESLGIWALTRADEAYPQRLKDRLKGQAPPVLFGAGPQTALNTTGLAVVGSRDVDAAGADFATLLGERCADEGLTVFSGGARGVDQLAVQGCVERGGAGVAVVAESLERMLKRREIGRSVLESRLTIVTPFHPSAGFTVAGAMGRNKLVYALASWAAVVSSTLESGGTWAGAIENLRAGWVPLFVRTGLDLPAGNAELVKRGAIALDRTDLTDGFRRWLEERASASHVVVEPIPMVRETASPFPAASTPSDAGESGDLFLLVWPQLAAFLGTARTENEVAEAFVLERAQVKAWLARGVRDGLVERSRRPVKYKVPARSAGTYRTPLFDEMP